MRQIAQHQTIEWTFKSTKRYSDPFNEVELSVRFEHMDGTKQVVPAFWAGGRNWRVRFSSPATGKYRFQSICSDSTNAGLNRQEGEFKVGTYAGSNPLYRHGAVRVAADQRHFEHVDGKPFFWLGDTWWMGLCKRLGWPKEFHTLSADRAKKGFTVVQIVAGLYPDMSAFDASGANEGGFPWDKEYQCINPAYFDKADRRLKHLVKSGLMPCLVGCWGYFLTWMGVEKIKRHWRYLVARYGSYPMVWCLAGEATMPYYLWDDQGEVVSQKTGWTEVAAYVRQIDSFHRPITIHPASTSARINVADPSVLDFDMLSTGHDDRASYAYAMRLLTKAYQTEPRMPVVEGESVYEGIGAFCGSDVQRLMFWTCLLKGAGGFTYGANGIWQVNTRAHPFAASPTRMSWGTTPWQDAFQLPGSKQMGFAKRFLERYRWWEFEPHPEWIEPGWSDDLCNMPFTWDRHIVPFAGGIPRQVHVIYAPTRMGALIVKGLKKRGEYRVRLFNPIDGSEQDRGVIRADSSGNWKVFPEMPKWYPFPVYQDWVLALEVSTVSVDEVDRAKRDQRIRKQTPTAASPSTKLHSKRHSYSSAK
jgi:hypothetical protein